MLMHSVLEGLNSIIIADYANIAVWESVSDMDCGVYEYQASGVGSWDSFGGWMTRHWQDGRNGYYTQTIPVLDIEQ